VEALGRVIRRIKGEVEALYSDTFLVSGIMGRWVPAGFLRDSVETPLVRALWKHKGALNPEIKPKAKSLWPLGLNSG
jgi:hypothetical protein